MMAAVRHSGAGSGLQQPAGLLKGRLIFRQRGLHALERLFCAFQLFFRFAQIFSGLLQNIDQHGVLR